MKKGISGYFRILKDLFCKITASDKNRNKYKFEEALKLAIDMIVKQSSSGGKLLFIGNGASAAISSHISTDFWKNAGIKALAFNDSSLLTCLSNDYGYKYVFEKPIAMFADARDILIAISSSGKSENIIRGVKMARLKGLRVITLSGFTKNNPLSLLGDLNFYLPSSSYGYVEIVHHSICHCLVDSILCARKVKRNISNNITKR